MNAVRFELQGVNENQFTKSRVQGTCTLCEATLVKFNPPKHQIVWRDGSGICHTCCLGLRLMQAEADRRIPAPKRTVFTEGRQYWNQKFYQKADEILEKFYPESFEELR